MNAKKWMKVGLFATLGLGWAFTSTPSAYASELRSGYIASGCSGSCMDVWQVQCKDTATHTVRAWVKDPAAPIVNVIVTNMGYTGPTALIGKADPEIGASSYSPASDLVRPGTTHGVTKSLVAVSVEEAPYSSSYDLLVACYDVNGSQVGDPVLKLLQNQ